MDGDAVERVLRGEPHALRAELEHAAAQGDPRRVDQSRTDRARVARISIRL
jgi:hypothetical protein